ncbi:MAG TPA: ABC transporter permease [Nitrososphaerales archaeon]|nr:ABC transporter permease [Nitrososphaerales archaeon]
MSLQRTGKSRLSAILHFIYSIMFRTKSAKLGSAIVIGFVVLALFGPLVYPYSPTATSRFHNQPPNYTHLLGTDNLGHDVLSQTIFGARPSIAIGVGAAVGAAIIGMLVGVFAGYYEKLESFFTGFADTIMTLPALPLLILVGTVYIANDVLIVGLLILVLWPPIARASRSQILSVKSLPYIEAAKAGGMKDREIIFKILVPEIAPIAIAYFVLAVAGAIVVVAGLDFLGVGNPNNINWGSMLYWAQQFAFYLGDWWWILAPGLAITLLATGFALIGFSVEEATNPRLRM